MSHKIVHWKYYLINAGVLTVLMGLTVLFAKWPALHFSDNPNGINLLIAILIAVMKAACIVAIFMGAYWSTGLVRLFALLGFIWLPIFFLFTFTDYGFANPVEKFGTPYGDFHAPGQNPSPGGQSFTTRGREVAPASGGNYVPPPHLFGHGEEAGHGGQTGHDASTDPGGEAHHDAGGEH